MPQNLVVNNNTFAYPIAGDEPGWGEAATGWAVEVTTALQSLEGVNDILQTTFNIANNTSVAAEIVGLIFNAAQVRSAIVEYSVYRTGTGPTVELSETGTLHLIYKNGAAVNSKWSIGRVFFGDDAGVLFTMTDAGQVKYTSTNISGTYTGTMHFSAKVTLQ
jgi:hypothetical protein